VWAVGDAELDKKIAAEAERRTKENAKFLDQKMKKKAELNRMTRLQQIQQIEAKNVILDSDKKKQLQEYERDQ